MTMNEGTKPGVGNQPTVDQLAQLTDYRGAAKAGWICLAVGLVAAMIPVLGWLVVGPMMLVTLILGVVVMAKGGIGHGLGIALGAVLGMPLIAVIGAGVFFLGATA